MKQTVTVSYNDGRVVTGTVGPREFVDFERKFGVGVSALADGAHVEWVYYLAFLAMRGAHKAGQHDGTIKATFDDFLDVVDDVDLAEADAAPLAAEASSSG